MPLIISRLKFSPAKFSRPFCQVAQRIRVGCSPRAQMPERKSQPWLCLLGTEQRFPSPSSCTAAVRGSLCNVVSRSFCISCSKMSNTRSSVKSVKCPHGKARITRHLQLLYSFQINTNYLPSKPSPGKQTVVWH